MSLLMRLLAGVVLVCWTVWPVSPAAAQVVQQQPRGPARGARPGIPFGNAPEPTMVTCEGTIAGMARGMVRITGKGNEVWMIQVPPNAEFLVTGPASPDLLKPGEAVEFVANVTRHGKVQEPIASLTIFTVSQQNFLGMFPEEPGVFDKEPDKAAPGAAEKGAKREKTDKGDVAASRYTVRGRITAIKKSKLVLSTGDKTVEGELADNVKVELRVADSRYAKPGDKISCTAIQLGTNPPQATKVRIALAGSPENTPVETDPTVKSSKTDTEKPADKDDTRGAREQTADAPTDETAEQLIKLLTPKEPAEKEESFRIDGDSTEFQRSVLGPAATLQRRFGKPERLTVKGILTTDGKDRNVHWQVWTWGTVRVVVDSSRKARFFASTAPSTTAPSTTTEPTKTEPAPAEPFKTDAPGGSKPETKPEAKSEPDKPK